MTELLTESSSDSPSEPLSPEVESRRASLISARNVGVVFAVVVAVAGSTQTGLGLVISVVVAMAAVARIVGVRTAAGRWCVAWALVAPMLAIRDNSWLALGYLAVAVAVAAISLSAHASSQTITDFEVDRLNRREPSLEARTLKALVPESGSYGAHIAPIVRGIVLAIPVLWVFGSLLSSADEVFGNLISFDGVDLGFVQFSRIGLFVLTAVLVVPVLAAGADSRTGTSSEVKARLGNVEATIVLGSVNVLFGAFVLLRGMSVGEQLPDELFRSDVRAGFFQLLWVAALTVMLILAVRRYGGEAMKNQRVRTLALTAITLAAAIDALALIRIGEYVGATFSTPLRFWSFAFGLWLIAVLFLTGLRLTPFRQDRQWFTFGLVSSAMVFVLAMAFTNPDVRIAEHNFANPPEGEGQFISVMPLIWLSDDATPVIVDNIEALRFLPNNRFERMVDHLCIDPASSSWRDVHFSRAAAESSRIELCSDS